MNQINYQYNIKNIAGTYNIQAENDKEVLNKLRNQMGARFQYVLTVFRSDNAKLIHAA